MGPELNYPKSVTEYWNKKAIKSLYSESIIFRHGENAQTSKPQLKRYRRNRLLFRIHGKSQAIQFRIQYTFRHNNSFSTETLLA
jgi:hypothetical protein